MHKRVIGIFTGVCILALTGCNANKVELEAVYITPYEREQYETAVVECVDVNPNLSVQLSPAEKHLVTYNPPKAEMEVDKVFVREGDFVKPGDVLITFKSGDIDDKVVEYQEELELQQLLIEHYENMMLLNTELDFREDIELLKKDMEITKLYIAEESAKMDEYTIRAEQAGVVEEVSELMKMQKVNPSDRLISLIYNNGEYRATISDDYPFEVGKVYEGVYNDDNYEVTLISEEVTENGNRNLTFKAVNHNSIMRVNFLHLTIEKGKISDALLVNKKAVTELKGKYYAFTLNESGFKQGVEVEVGEEIGDKILIKSGLKAGDRVVVNQ